MLQQKHIVESHPLPEKLSKVIEYYSTTNPVHFYSLANQLPLEDLTYVKKVEEHLLSFNQLMIEIGKDFNYGLNCYSRKICDIIEEQIQFTHNGMYSHSSFDEVNKNVYNNPEVMEYHTIGLLLMQILRVNNYKKLNDFISIIAKRKKTIKKYLEIAGGHGLYTMEVCKILQHNAVIDFIDISEVSIQIAKSFLKGWNVRFHHQNIFNYEPGIKYDFITLGEILEHLEDPRELLLKTKSMLTDAGLCFITIPINMPAIDHIYLFKDKNEIRTMICNAGLKIVGDFVAPEYKGNHHNQANLPHSYWAIVSK